MERINLTDEIRCTGQGTQGADLEYHCSVCNKWKPKPPVIKSVDFFGAKTYQCGCGRYFTDIPKGKQ